MESNNIQLLSNRFVNGRSYLLLYIFILIITVVDTILGVLYVVLDQDNYALSCITIMIILTMLIVLEVILRYLAMKDREKFFEQCANKVDVAVIVLGIVGLVLFIVGFDGRTKTFSDDADIFDNALLLSRSVYMFIRLYFLFSSNKGKAFRMGRNNDDDIDFQVVMDEPLHSSWDGDHEEVQDVPGEYRALSL